MAVARSALVSRSNFCICKLISGHKADVFSILAPNPFCNNFASVYPIFLPMPLSPTPHQWLVYREEGQFDRNKGWRMSCAQSGEASTGVTVSSWS